MSIVNTRKFGYAKRKLDNSNKIKEIFATKKEQSEILSESARIIQETKREDNYAKAYSKSNSRRTEKSNREKFIIEESNKLRAKLTKAITFKAIPLDKQIRDINADFINKQSTGFATKLMGSAPEEVTKSLSFKNVLHKLDNYVLEAAIVFNDKDKVMEIMAEANVHIEKFANTVGPIIESKVIETIRVEKSMNQLNESIGSNETSLFKEILSHNIKQCMLENQITKMEDAVMDTAFAESVFDYTLLEMANTLRMVEFSNLKLKGNLRGFFKEESNKYSQSLQESASVTQKSSVRLNGYNVPQDVSKVRFSINESVVTMELLDSEGSLTEESKYVELGKLEDGINLTKVFKENFINSRLSARYFEKEFVLLTNHQEVKI